MQSEPAGLESLEAAEQSFGDEQTREEREQQAVAVA